MTNRTLPPPPPPSRPDNTYGGFVLTKRERARVARGEVLPTYENTYNSMPRKPNTAPKKKDNTWVVGLIIIGAIVTIPILILAFLYPPASILGIPLWGYLLIFYAVQGDRRGSK